MENFELYTTVQGLQPVASPVKREILALLQEGPLTQVQITEAVRRAQSTTARHLLELEAARFIESSLDPADNRRKLYALAGRPAATSGEPSKGLTPFLEQIIQNGLTGKTSLLEAINRSIRFTVESWGLTFDDLLREAGRTIGKQIASTMPPTPKLQDLAGEVASFWARHNLGEVEVESLAPPVFIVEGCYDCGGAPDIGRPLCALDEGILEAVLAHHLGGRWRVREVECHGTGHDHCRFEVSHLSSSKPEDPAEQNQA